MLWSLLLRWAVLLLIELRFSVIGFESDRFVRCCCFGEALCDCLVLLRLLISA